MRALLPLFASSALAQLDPNRFKLTGYGPASPEDVSELALIAGGPSRIWQMIPQEKSEDSKPSTEQLAAKDIKTKAVVISSFQMEKTAVSNAQFARFIEVSPTTAPPRLRAATKPDLTLLLSCLPLSSSFSARSSRIVPGHGSGVRCGRRGVVTGAEAASAAR